ncbi:MAG TPA: Crp/Fnr family transcriptional regulator [Gemmatimonadaceae bacterium]|nr:Crp/Fnr family transcriptional regulator [Gemmatimonadaceae bacterium]
MRQSDTEQGAPATGPRNRLLGALPESDLARLARSLERIALEPRAVLFDPDRPIEHVYFPEDCVGSIVGIMADGSAVETATVGREGMIGLPVYLGDGRTSAQAFCQVPGEALRMEARRFRRELERGGPLLSLLNRYTQALISQIAQSSACNRLHPLRQRCARWLLQTRDCVGRDEFAFTHQFLSQMLGVRRSTVTELAGELERAGLIRNRYGRIIILDRDGLEGTACECYRIIRREFERLLEGRESPNPLSGVRVSEGGKSVVGDGVPRAEGDG